MNTRQRLRRRAPETVRPLRPSRFERAVDRVPFLEKELFLLRDLVRPGDVCVDVGAAGGAHLFVMARGTGPRGRVIGVEPRPGSHRILTGMVRAAGLAGRVSLHQVALTDGVGNIELRVPVVPTRAHLSGSTADPEAAAAFARLPHRRISVPTTTLDRLVADESVNRVDVLKCDVEGAELLVLAGATEVLTEHRPVVIVEADDLHQQRFDATAQDVVDAIAGYGYLAHRYRHGRIERVPGVVGGEDDYVMIPAERRERALLAG